MKTVLFKIVRIRYILTTLVIGTIIFLILNPEFLFENAEYFKAEKTIIDRANHYTLLSENNDYDICYFIEGGKNYFNFNFKDFHSGGLKQIELRGFSIYSSIRDNYNNCYYDMENNKVYIIGTKNRADYYLFESDGYKSRKYELFHHDLYDSLCDSIIVVNHTKFYSYKISNTMKDSLCIDSYKDGYKIILNRKTHENIHKPEMHTNICKELSKKTGTNFKPQDLHKIINFFLRNSYYHDRIFVKEESKRRGFTSAEILGKLDSNNDGEKDFLIQLVGDRWLPCILLCYDKFNKKVLWKKEYANGGIKEHKIVDIDNDGIEEIIISSYSPCNQQPIDAHEKEYLGSLIRAQLIILDNNGKVKEINNKPVIISSSIGYYKYKFSYLPESNSIIMGLYSQFNFDDKKVQLLDLNNNVVSELDISYQHMMGIKRDKNNIILVNRNQNRLEKIILDEKFKIKKKISIRINHTYNRYLGDRLFENNQQISTIDKPFTILDKNMRILYELPVIGDYYNWYNNDIYFIESNGYERYLAKLSFEHNQTLNPYIIIILLTEILLLILYLLISQLISIPISSPQKNYFILYNYYGKLFYWKIKGKLSASLDQTRSMSKNSKIPNSILSDLSDTPTLIYKKNFFFFKYLVYEIPSLDESKIIQRISHDLKNQVLMIKLLTDKYTEQLSEKNTTFVEEVSSSINSISTAAHTLSNFSHIDKLYKEEVEFNAFIKQLLIKHINHKLFENINYQPYSMSIVIGLDENLFRNAFDNLLKNALDEIEDEEIVNVTINQKNKKTTLQISNPYHDGDRDSTEFGKVGFSTKPQGSGIGLPISKVIIEKHKGNFDYYIIDKLFIVEISLPVS